MERPADLPFGRVPALLSSYWAFGQFWGVWVITITAYLTRHGMDDAAYGLHLMVLSISAVVVMASVSPRLAHLPLRTTVAAGVATLGIGSIAMAVSPASGLAGTAVIVGAGNGLIDVFSNTSAQRIEARTGRPILQWLHATYAAGGITGALIAGGVAALGIDERAAFLVAGAALLGSAAWNRMVGDPEGGDAMQARLSVSAFRRHPGLLAAGVVVLFAFLVEGSMDTWSGRYLQDSQGASAVAAAGVFVGFSTALCLGRLFAGKVLFGFGRRTTILAGGIGAMAAGLTSALSDTLGVVAVAYIVMGFVLSWVAPAGFGLVEDTAPGDQANAISAVTTLGYGGFVISPVLFGWIASTVDTRAAMIVIVASSLGIVLAGVRATATAREPA
jgi:MFS family permease